MPERHASEIDGERAEFVRAELTRLLGGAAFCTSKRCSEFLRYVVEHTLRGRSSELKERSLGVELFQLPPDFDTGQHAIVRVTANEVRKRLAQHYLANGNAAHPVRIDLPPGSYSAEFKWETPAPESRPAALPRKRIRPGIWGAAALLAVAVAISWYAVRSAPGDETASAPADFPAAVTAPPVGDLRIMVGSASSFTDRNGRVWSADRYFSGGSALSRPAERILRTLDPDIYRQFRSGDFRYDIPLKPGSYELRLHFAEVELPDTISAESSGEGQRVFEVLVNGKQVLEGFDVVSDAAGANIASERVFRDVSPSADGFLHLGFSPVRGSAILSGIEVLPVAKGQGRPIRVRAGWPTAWQDNSGQQWLADAYFLGGNALVRSKDPVQQDYPASSDRALYASERWGHFSYSLPVADGRYRVTMRFCEGHYGSRNVGRGGVGSRLFDVYCNGVALLRNFDIIKRAGGEGRPVALTFTGIRPNAQGKIVLNFVPVKSPACVNGIEVLEESASR